MEFIHLISSRLIELVTVYVSFESFLQMDYLNLSIVDLVFFPELAKVMQNDLAYACTMRNGRFTDHRSKELKIKFNEIKLRSPNFLLA